MPPDPHKLSCYVAWVAFGNLVWFRIQWSSYTSAADGLYTFKLHPTPLLCYVNLYITSVLVIANNFSPIMFCFVRDAFTNIFCQCSLQWNLPMFSTANIFHYTVYTLSRTILHSYNSLLFLYSFVNDFYLLSAEPLAMYNSITSIII